MMRESKKGPCKGALFLLGKVGLLKRLSFFKKKLTSVLLVIFGRNIKFGIFLGDIGIMQKIFTKIY